MARQFGLVLLPPGGQAVEEAEGVLGELVKRHLVLILAPLLGEGASTLVHPLVAVDLWLLLGHRWRGQRNDTIDVRLWSKIQVVSHFAPGVVREEEGSKEGKES